MNAAAITRPAPTPGDPAPALSIVMPAYNEAGRIGDSLRRIVAYRAARAGSPRWELLVADDGSADDTRAVVERIADELGATGWVRVLRRDDNRGKGDALRRGVLASRGRQVLLCDADLSTPIEDLERLEPHLDRAALVLGSRAVADAKVVVRQPRYREFMGKVFNVFVQLLATRGLRDTQCGFKLIEGDAARQLFTDLETDGFACDVELVWLARRDGHRVAEVGVTWLNSADSRVDPLRDPLRMLIAIVRFRWRHRRRPRVASSATPQDAVAHRE
ncbi:MAG: dolichyl-phosphate beta-glucosyltransferase [Acidobacteriota bacterium]